LARSARFSSLAFSLIEEVLGARCPLPAMQQVRLANLPSRKCCIQRLPLAGVLMLWFSHQHCSSNLG
jgi:hypothetical protein